MNQEQVRRIKDQLSTCLAVHKATAERFLAEMTFAEKLLELRGGRPATWRKYIAQAWQTVGKALDAGRLDRLRKAVAEAEQVLAPVAKVAKMYTIHCVGHAHIDMNWMWGWPETVAVTCDTFQTVLKLMEEFDDFRFTQSQISVYEILRRYRPDLLERVRARVREGRWEVAATQWVEGDKNIASGESLARHLLYSRQFTAEQFGLDVEDIPLDWEPDMFGHAHTLPTIVSRGGVKYYYMCRGGNFPKPPVFWWQGPDGRRVLNYVEQEWYNGEIAPANAQALLGFCEKTGLTDWMKVYGVGDHGGGPTRRDILRAREMNDWPVFPRFRFAFAREFYELLEKARKDWPVLDRELNYEFTGCYTSQSEIKKANRHGENLCLAAETVAAIASRATGAAYPHEQLRQAWVDTLFGHFHDILPGSGVAATRSYHLGKFQETAATTGVIRSQAYRALAGQVDTSFAGANEDNPSSRALGGGSGRNTTGGALSMPGLVTVGPRPFVVFNPTDCARRDVITVTVWDLDKNAEFRVRFPDGRTLPAQKLATGDYWAHTYIDLAVPVEVEALGYVSFVVEPGAAEPAETMLTVAQAYWAGERQCTFNYAMENEHLAAKFDATTGGAISLVDKSSGLELADPARPLGVLEHVIEQPRMMSSWLLNNDKSRDVVSLDGFELIHQGPYLATMVAKAKVGESTVEVTYTLKAGVPWLEMDLRTTWVERGSMDRGTPQLTLRIPTALSQVEPRYEIPFGWIRRQEHDGEEVPSNRWADLQGKVGGKTAGLTLVNDCKYGHSLRDSTLRLTLLRSSWQPDPLPEIGEHSMRLAIAPRGRTAAAGELTRLGIAWNHPLEAISTDVHVGPLETAATGVSVAPGDVVLSGIRVATEGDGLIFHLLNTGEKDAAGQVALNEALFGRPRSAGEVDLLERELDDGSAEVTSGGFSVTVPARGIAAVRVGFQ